MDRYFVYNCCVYDMKNPKERVAYPDESTAEIMASKLNAGLDRMNPWWCGESHLTAHGQWAPKEQFVSEYTLACQVLGEDYF